MSLFSCKIIRAAAIAAFSWFAAAAYAAETEVAIFAGGCFWCTEADFDKVDGVISTISGFIGGHKEDPSYMEVSAGGTGHTEAVEIEYDPDKVSYRELLDVFWINHDPTTNTRQFCDKGRQYRPGIFYTNAEQQRLAEEKKQEVEQSVSFPIVTEITEATEFYAAEGYHQDYYKKNPVRYNYYRFACGRDDRLEDLWGKQEKS